MTKAVLLLSPALVLAGCGVYGWDPLVTRPHRRVASDVSVGVGSTHLAAEEVLTEGPVVAALIGGAERPCEVLALLDEHAAAGNERLALDRLRREASILGADAVTHVRYEYVDDDPGGSDEASFHLTGTAVRFVDVVGGRPYEILGRLAVTERLGREAEALAMLRRGALALHADAVLGVTIDPDDHDGTVAVSATAVRFLDR